MRLLFIVLSIDRVQIVRALIGYSLDGLETFIDVRGLFVEVVAVCCVGVEFVG